MAIKEVSILHERNTTNIEIDAAARYHISFTTESNGILTPLPTKLDGSAEKCGDNQVRQICLVRSSLLPYFLLRQKLRIASKIVQTL